MNFREKLTLHIRFSIWNQSSSLQRHLPTPCG